MIPLYNSIDTETEINNTGDEAVGNFSASPFSPVNRIVYLGISQSTNVEDVLVFKDLRNFKLDLTKVFVAHNAEFDLLYLLCDGLIDVKDLADLSMWDTAYAEYLLSGGADLYPTLDFCAAKYGGTLKDSKMKEYWKQGITTSLIPESEIVPYLRYDVANCALAFEKQYEEAIRIGALDYIWASMDARLATVVAEYNGMNFDREKCIKLRDELKIKLDATAMDLTVQLVAYIVDNEIGHAVTAEEVLSCTAGDLLNSNKILKTVVYGNIPLKFKRLAPVLDDEGNQVKYKTGKRKGELKFKNEDAYALPTPFLSTKEASVLNGSVDKETVDKVIKILNKRDASSVAAVFLTALLDYRRLSKEYSTYLVGFLSHVWPGNLIHGSINHTGTRTTRTNSSAPNLANISAKEVDDE